jgi:glycosyltransferase involved in cell wall biosynthesis
MTNPTISIITRTKDRRLLLPRALQSVLRQTREDWELIIVNDGGDPEPVDRLLQAHKSEAGNRVRVIHREVSTGMEAASNAGIVQASGRYLVIHDDDDSWHPEFLRTCLDHLEQAGPRVGGVVTHSSRVSENIADGAVEILGRTPYNPWLTWVSIADMAHGNLFSPISFVFRRSVYDEVGGFREDLPVLGDWEFNLRFLAGYEIDVIPKELANYHLRQRQLTGNYGNTVVAGADLHARYLRQIRNELLRADLKSGRFGLGVLVNIGSLLDRSGQSTEGTKQAIRDTQARLLNDVTISLRRAGVREVLVYGAGEVGRRFAEIAAAMGLRIVGFVDGNERLWGAQIGRTEITSLARAAQTGLHRYVVASFAFDDEIAAEIRRFHQVNGLPNPEIHLPLGGQSGGAQGNR